MAGRDVYRATPAISRTSVFVVLFDCVCQSFVLRFAAWRIFCLKASARQLQSLTRRDLYRALPFVTACLGSSVSSKGPPLFSLLKRHARVQSTYSNPNTPRNDIISRNGLHVFKDLDFKECFILSLTENILNPMGELGHVQLFTEIWVSHYLFSLNQRKLESIIHL